MIRPSRRAVYRAAKRRLVKLLRRSSHLPRRMAERIARQFLMGRRRGYLLALLGRQAVAMAAVAVILASAPSAAQKPVELSAVGGGIGGYRIENIPTLHSFSPQQISYAGDVNNDGIPDFVVGNGPGYFQSNEEVGEAYVIFGDAGGTNVDISQLEYSGRGFKIEIGAATYVGGIAYSVAGGGDINGDGYDDLVISAPNAHVDGPYGPSERGKAYVVFGKEDGTTVTLADIESEIGARGFVINGRTPTDLDFNDLGTGMSVSIVGDMNSDGKDEVVLSTWYDGAAYVVFGRTGTAPVSVDSIAAGTGDGFAIKTNDALNNPVGSWVADAGDVNNDGKGDIVVFEAPHFPAYVVFGRASFSPVFVDSIEPDGTGFAINAGSLDDSMMPLFIANGAGDVNGDGMDDIILGSRERYFVYDQNPYDVYVVFGKQFSTPVSLEDIFNGEGGGFRIIEPPQTTDDFGQYSGFGTLGHGLSAAGDVNGDGFGDVIVGAPKADRLRYEGYNVYGFPVYEFSHDIGVAYVVFGKSDTDPVHLENVIHGAGGFAIGGDPGVYLDYINNYTYIGSSVSTAGDVDGDGLDDLLVMAPGELGAYVVFSPLPAPIRTVLRTDGGTPIRDGAVFIERTDVPFGFETAFVGADGNDDALYRSPDTEKRPYTVRAAAPGFLPSSEITVTPDLSGTSPDVITLVSDVGLNNPNILRVVINVHDQFDVPTGTKLMSKLVELRQDAALLPLTPVFGDGEMAFIGVPVGTIDVSAPDSENYTFTSAAVTLGTGVDRTVVIAAQSIFFDEARAAGIPATISGKSVDASAGLEPLPGLVGVRISAETENADYIPWTDSVADGAYLLTDIPPGTGTFQAISPDRMVTGEKKNYFLQDGQLLGETAEQQEITRLKVNPKGSDVDFDGLTDAFEQQYFGSADSSQGPLDDPDGDGLTNLAESLIAEEFGTATNPTTSDTDGDGFSDPFELYHGSDPTDEESVPLALPSEVWVDFGYQGPQAGTLMHPFSTMNTAIRFVAENGIIRVKGDVELLTGARPDDSIVSKRLTLTAFRGTIRIE